MIQPQRNPKIKTTLLPDGHVVLFGEESNWAQVLNPTGAMVWEFCDGKHTAASIAEEINHLLEGTGSTAQSANIEGLINNLLESGLLICSHPIE